MSGAEPDELDIAEDITPGTARQAQPEQDRPERDRSRGSAWTSGALWAGIRDRARRDRPLLLTLLVTVAVSAAVALSGPRLLGHALDAGLRGAVAGAGPAGQLRMVVPLDLDRDAAGLTDGNAEPPIVSGDDLGTAATVFSAGLPPALDRVRGPMLIDATSNPMVASVEGGAGRPLTLRLGYAAGPGSAVDYVSGDAPTDAAAHPLQGVVIPVAVTRTVAEATGLRLGSRVRLNPARAPAFTVLVTGIVRPRDPGAAAWQALPSLLAPKVFTGSQARVDGTVLLAGSGLPAAETALRGTGSFSATLRQTVDTGTLTGADIPALRQGLALLAASPPKLPVQAVAHTELPQLLDEYGRQAVAVRAQLSVLLVGAVGVAILLTLLAAQALIGRRREDLALEYARGASLSVVAVRLLLESALVALSGCLLAVLLVGAAGAALGGWSQLWPAAGLGSVADMLPLLVVLLVAVSGPPLLGAWVARQAWAGAAGGRRRAGGRLQTRRARAQGRSRRLVLEGVLLVIAVGAVLSLRSRGVAAPADGFSGDVDPYLAAAPTLLALAAALLAVRLQPWPLRVLTAAARRGRGMVAMVATARAGRSLGGIPLLTLTLAVGIAIATGLIRETVLSGQDTASWQRVGAEVRAGGTFSPAEADQLRREPGVNQVALGSRLGALRVRIANRSEQVQVIAVDAGRYAAVLADTPLGGAGSIAALAGGVQGGSSPSSPLPVAISADLLSRAGGQDVAIFFDDRYHPVHPVAPAPAATAGWVSGPVLFVDSRAVQASTGRPVPATLLWATGPGAERAVGALTDGRPGSVLTRSGWLRGRRASALVHQVLWLSWLAATGTGVLAGAAVVSSVLTGARQRGRALAVLRTLGLRLRPGRLLAVAELAPMMVVGTAAGGLAGVAIVLLLGPALGLDILTGGLGIPPVRSDPWFVAVVAAGVLAVFGLATTAELSAHRRDRLSDVMRTR